MGRTTQARMLRGAGRASRPTTPISRAVMRRDNNALSPVPPLIYWTCGHIYAKQTNRSPAISKSRLREVMAATLPPPRLLPSGDSAVTVEFSRDIDDDANQRVLALDRAVSQAALDGVTEAVPTYRSLLVHYDPGTIGF